MTSPYCFNPCCAGCSSGSIFTSGSSTVIESFNPCCAGCSSGRMRPRKTNIQVMQVSILVVLDVVLEAW